VPSSRGFTLIEALLATALAATLVASLAGILPKTVDASRSLTQRYEPNQTARAILALMARDLRCAQIADEASSKGSLNFISNAPSSTPNGSPARITYRLSGSSPAGGRRLWRDESPLGSAPKAPTQLIADGVAELRIQAWHEGQWLNQKPSDEPPRAIRLLIRMNGQHRPSIRTVILPSLLGQTPAVAEGL